MPGIARKLYKEVHGTPLFESNSESKEPSLWEELIQAGRISIVDLELSKRLISSEVEIDSEGLLALLCHLIRACKQGHLCVKCTEETLYPCPSEDFLAPLEGEGVEKVNAELLCIPEQMLEAFKRLKNAEYPSLFSKDKRLTALSIEGDRLYLQKTFYYESLLVEQFHRVSSSKALIDISESDLSAQLEQLTKEGKQLLPAQVEAIKAVTEKSLTVITGGPGTGKTFTAAQIIRLVLASLNDEQRSKFRISLAAPTGKAGGNFQGALKRALEGSPVDLEVQTLHRLLRVYPGKEEKFKPEEAVLPVDLVLVDECSMVDVKLMARLFSSIPSGARLILLGDEAQLPAVEAGGIFADMLSLGLDKTHKDPLFSCVELRECKRTDVKTLTEFSTAIRRGDEAEALKFLQEGQSSLVGVNWTYGELSERKGFREVVEHISREFEKNLTAAQSVDEDGKAFNRYRALCPLREGPWGVNELNAQILESYLRNLRKKGAKVYIPIMVTRNSSDLGLYNGEVGVLIEDAGGRQAYFFDRQEGGYRSFTEQVLPPYEYAFCMSVHKSQGSEFDHVALLLPEGSQRFGREVLYTGATRARKRLDVLGKKELVRAILAKQEKRLSGFHEKIKSRM